MSFEKEQEHSVFLQHRNEGYTAMSHVATANPSMTFIQVKHAYLQQQNDLVARDREIENQRRRAEFDEQDRLRREADEKAVIDESPNQISIFAYLSRV